MIRIEKNNFRVLYVNLNIFLYLFFSNFLKSGYG